MNMSMLGKSMLGRLLILSLAANGALQTAVTQDPSGAQITLDSRTTSSVNHISILLRQAAVWGGIEDYRSDCGSDPDIRLPAVNGTLKEAFTQLMSQDASINWRAENDGILVRRNAPATSLLDTKITEFTFDTSDAPDKATDVLLNLPAVQRQITASNLSVRSPELGFAQARSKSQDILTLKDITLRQGLNAIARSTHPRVWLPGKSLAKDRTRCRCNGW